jgi:hypothetical protein
VLQESPTSMGWKNTQAAGPNKTRQCHSKGLSHRSKESKDRSDNTVYI